VTVDEPEILDAGRPGAERIPSFGTVETPSSGRSWTKPLLLVAAAIAAFVLVANVGGDTPPPVADSDDEAATDEAEAPLTPDEIVDRLTRGASGLDGWFRLNLPDGLITESTTIDASDELLVLVTDGGRPATRTLLRSGDGETWAGAVVPPPSVLADAAPSLSARRSPPLWSDMTTFSSPVADGGETWTVFRSFQRSQVRTLDDFDGARVGSVAVVARVDGDGAAHRIEGAEVQEVDLPGPVVALASDRGGFVALVEDEFTTVVLASADGVAWAEIDRLELDPQRATLGELGAIAVASNGLGPVTLAKVDGAELRLTSTGLVGFPVLPPALAGGRGILLGSGTELSADEVDALSSPIVVGDHDGREATLSVTPASADPTFVFDGTAIGAGTRQIDASGDDEEGIRFVTDEEDTSLEFLEVLDLDTGEVLARFSSVDFEAAFEEAFGDLDRVFGEPRLLLSTSDDGGATWQTVDLVEQPGLLEASRPEAVLTAARISAMRSAADLWFRPATD